VTSASDSAAGSTVYTDCDAVSLATITTVTVKAGTHNNELNCILWEHINFSSHSQRLEHVNFYSTYRPN